ncbi:MAG: hypothetical protein WAQ98_18960 [Blastocatellia bacterium]
MSMSNLINANNVSQPNKNEAHLSYERLNVEKSFNFEQLNFLLAVDELVSDFDSMFDALVANN